MGYRHLTSIQDGVVARLTLNRPEVRNALNDEVIAELTTWAETMRGDGQVRVAVIAGEGSIFSAGADMSWMARTATFTRDENVADATALARMFRALDTLPMPLVARVHGAAIGGGAGLAAVADVVIAADDTVFGFTEVKLGIVPAVISPFVIAKIGESAARELFLTGRRFSASRAQQIGLVHAVTSAADLDEEVGRYVAEITSAGPEAVAAAKRLIREVRDTSLDRLSALTAERIAERRVSREGQEGLRAFLEKRRPTWS